MSGKNKLNRRRFTQSLVLGGGWLASGFHLSTTRAENRLSNSAVQGETPHFWYRVPADGVFVHSQRGHMAFGYTDGQIMLSEDCAHHWSRRIEFPDARKIVFSCIMGNGNVLFAARAKLYLSTDGLRSYRELTPQLPDGTDFYTHTPRNPNFPGWYYHSLSGIHTFDVDGREMVVWGNYCNVVDGAAPVCIYYSTDSGRTVKVAYRFGRNPDYTDNGTPGGGKSGFVLGGIGNEVKCRHIHGVFYNPEERAFYATTGDHDKAWGHECHWLRGTYNAANDMWDWRVIVSDSPNTRYKCGGLNFAEGKLYWISDANGPQPHDRGVFCCKPADILHRDRHERLFQPGVESANMVIHDRVMLASHCAPASPMACGFIISTDFGHSWAQYDLKELGRRSPCRFHPPNDEGWFRVDLRHHWVTPGEMLFIKPKPAA